MEQVRLLAAIGLSFLVLFIWSMFFNYNTDVNQEKQTEFEIETFKTDSNIVQEFPVETEIYESKNNNNFRSNFKHKPREIIVDTTLFRMVLSERGGSIKSVILKNYKETNSQDRLKEILSNNLIAGNMIARLSSTNKNEVQNSIFTSDLEVNHLEVINNETVNFEWSDGKGKTIVKSFIFRPDTYLVDMNVIVKNTSDHIVNDSLILSIYGEAPSKSSYGFEGPSAFIDGHLKQFKVKDIKTENSHKGVIDWIAIEDRYFMSSIIPCFDFNSNVELNIEKNLIENNIITKSFNISPQQQIKFETLLFVGPKSIDILKSIGHNMNKAINFGIFNFIAKPCLWFMNKIYSFIPNYGIAIIMLTLCTKLLLWPLGSKGYKSMSEMKKLQPLMNEIRTKYKNDKQKMNQEIMALYKTYKVNPMGGCLPMLLQIPFFFALYRMLYQAIELRHAPFIFWINDLSAPDRLFDFGFSVPFMQAPYGIPVLTIMMGATMLVQQKMSPPPGDPAQAKMMLFMPIIFTFIFINFSSGLVLYWLVNNVLSITQQYYIQKKTT